MDHWLVQSIIANSAWLVLGLVGAAALPLLRTYWPQFAERAVYGLVGFVLIAGTVLLVLSQNWFSELERLVPTN